MLGRKLTERLLERGQLRGESIGAIDLVDLVEARAESEVCTAHVADLSRPGAAESLISLGADVVFHLAAVVSAEAEADFDKGMAVNATAPANCSTASPLSRPGWSTPQRGVRIAVPRSHSRRLHPTPLTSYGTQKLIGEALLADYSRRGFFDGIGIRLPTVSVRPGAPNAAASSFFSGIIREPLNGVEAELPVGRDVRHPHVSPRAAVGFLVHAAELDTQRLQGRRNLTMPGVSSRSVRGPQAGGRPGRGRADHRVPSWPWSSRFDARATALAADRSRCPSDRRSPIPWSPDDFRSTDAAHPRHPLSTPSTLDPRHSYGDPEADRRHRASPTVLPARILRRHRVKDANVRLPTFQDAAVRSLGAVHLPDAWRRCPPWQFLSRP